MTKDEVVKALRFGRIVGLESEYNWRNHLADWIEREGVDGGQCQCADRQSAQPLVEVGSTVEPWQDYGHRIVTAIAPAARHKIATGTMGCREMVLMDDGRACPVLEATVIKSPDLREGDRVEIVGGEHKGRQGVYDPDGGGNDIRLHAVADKCVEWLSVKAIGGRANVRIVHRGKP